jgi:glutaminase
MDIAVINSPIQSYLDSIHLRFASLMEGAVADYIPELALANPNWFGISIATHDGQVYEVGDTQQPFTIQSLSKPLTYGLALEQNGMDAVLQKIGVEPSGDAFNAISLQPGTGRPLNPLINAGAIAACGLIAGHTAAQKVEYIRDTFSKYAGRSLQINDKVYRSESATGHRNRAIGWMLHNFSILDSEPTPTLEAYFQQCAIEINCRDLALMGATLANGGVHPLTGVRALEQDYVRNVLSVMATCGMYDASGEWLYRTGLPAKSGVGGGVLAVQPGRLAIAVFSPLLDAQGNSHRGVAVCRALAEDLHLHLLDGAERALSPVRRQLTRRTTASKRTRSVAVSEYLKGQGGRIRLYQLHGILVFSSVEEVVRKLVQHAPDTDVFLLNLKLVQGINAPSARLLLDTQVALQAQGKQVLFTEASTWWQVLVEAGVAQEAFYADDDFALEHAENVVLNNTEGASMPEADTRGADCALFAGLFPAEMAVLDGLLERRTYTQGQSMVTIGQASDELFVILEGEAMVSTPTETGIARLNVFSAGGTFGEVAFIDRSPRSANVTALATVQCKVLTRTAFAQLEGIAPAVKIKLMENIALVLANTLRQISREYAALK